MKKIYITENQILKLKEESEKKITFYEFFNSIKSFLKKILSDPKNADVDDLIKDVIDKKELITQLKKNHIITSKEQIKEVPDDEDEKKLVGKRFIQYKIPKKGFEEKVKKLYDSLYSKPKINEEGEGGATSCGSAMQGGGGNPDAGQFIVPFGKVQRRKIKRKFE